MTKAQYFTPFSRLKIQKKGKKRQNILTGQELFCNIEFLLAQISELFRTIGKTTKTNEHEKYRVYVVCLTH